MTFSAHRPGDGGSGSVLALAIVCALAAAVAIAVPLSYALVIRSGVAGAADASALAAADVAAGIHPGEPCAIAEAVSTANGADPVSCVVDGLVVTVTSNRSFLGIALQASATAGPPGAVSK